MRDRAGTASGAPAAVPGQRSIVVTLVVGFALLGGGVAVALSQRAVHPAATNRTTSGGALMTTAADRHLCQARERIPAGTAAVRISLGSLTRPAPRIGLLVRDASGVRASGASGARWSRHAVVVPLRRPLAEDVGGRVCIRLAPTGSHERVRFFGQQPDLTEVGPGEVRSARLRFEYLLPHRASWWEFGGTVADRLGRGHPWSGRSVALGVALLVLLAIALGSWQLVDRDAGA